MTANEKFKDLPIDPETKLFLSSTMLLGEYEIRYQKWFWDGIYAESIIFFNEDISSLSKEEVILEVKTSPIVKDESQITYSKGDMYTFVNFNFTTE